MTRPRTKNGKGVHFPFTFIKNGRHARIKKWSEGKFGTYFVHGLKKNRNSFKSFEAAYDYLDRTFAALDAGIAPTVALADTASEDLRVFRELNQLLREGAPGSTLREAVDYFLANRQTSKVTPKPLEACIAAYIAEEEGRNVSGLHLTTLNRHLGHFKKKFAGRKIHEITTAEILAPAPLTRLCIESTLRGWRRNHQGIER